MACPRVATLLLFIGATWIVFRQLWRETFMRRPRLVADSGRLVVHHPVYLRKPYPIDREDVVAVPNVALHLRRPIELDDYRRVGLNRTIRGKPWPETSPKRGLLLAVQDLDALEGVLRAWGLEQKFGLRQVEIVRPSPIDVKLARREMIGGLFFLAYLVAVVVNWLVELFTD